jgi:hypothetical protein
MPIAVASRYYALDDAHQQVFFSVQWPSAQCIYKKVAINEAMTRSWWSFLDIGKYDILKFHFLKLSAGTAISLRMTKEPSE